MELIGYLWLEYYYPLLTNDTYLPQGNRAPGKSDVAFREEVETLGQRFGKTGNLFALKKALHQPVLGKDLKSVLAKIRRALVQGPIKYAGNETLGGKIFRNTEQEILVPVGLWSELGRYGGWIRDAVVLQWADFIKERCEHKTNTGNCWTRLASSIG